MPPAKQYKVPSDKDSDFVIISAEGTNVKVEWLCGRTFTFTKDGARAMLDAFEHINLVPNLIFKCDSLGVPVYIKLVDGELQADDRIFDTATSGVSWDKFRDAFVKAIGPARTKSSPGRKTPAKAKAKRPAKKAA